MAKDPLAGLLSLGDPTKETEEEVEETEGADEGELAAAEAAISAINEGDSQAFLDAIKLIVKG